jgi:hypothetical protein
MARSEHLSDSLIFDGRLQHAALGNKVFVSGRIEFLKINVAQPAFQL